MAMYALVLAGGKGTRLWPHSRLGRPKQFLSIDGQRTMLQETVERSLPVIPMRRVWVATGRNYTELVQEQLPDVPAENILAEPAGRGTAPCIAWAAIHMLRHDPDAVMAVLSADHRIEEDELLCEQLLVGQEMAQKGYLVTLGIQPDTPATGYGYIQSGGRVQQMGNHEVHYVQSFTEKPDAVTAQRYLDSGGYFWNAGMFIWRADRILEELAQHYPPLMEAMKLIEQALNTPYEDVVLEAVWDQIENIAIDIAVMEKTSRAVVIPSPLGWSDVGDWDTLSAYLHRDDLGNAVIGRHLGMQTQNTLVYGNGRLIATIGLNDLMIIDTHDVLLICPRTHAQDVKAMVAQVKEHYQELL